MTILAKIKGFGFSSKKHEEQSLPDFALLIQKVPAAPPRWSEELNRSCPKGTKSPISNAVAKRIWAARPRLNAKEFAKYWTSANEAETAWKILHLAESNFDRPALPMAYPNDPMAIYSSWRGDSLDAEEYIIALEKMLDISIPDAEAEKIFCDFTLLETVRYLHTKQNECCIVGKG